MMKRTILTAAIWLSASLGAAAQVFLCTDKGSYLAGEQVLCSAFAADSCGIAYVELHSTDGQQVTGKIALEAGRGGGSISLPLNLPTGNYRIFGYTPLDRDNSRNLTEFASTISVYNTLCCDRVQGGVTIVDEAPSYSRPQASAGLSLETTDTTLVVNNISGSDASLCISVYVDDGLDAPGRRWIESPGHRTGSYSKRDGETVRARVEGDDGKSAKDGSVYGIISVPGSLTDIYTANLEEDCSLSFETENIYGKHDLVCMIQGANPLLDCHIELRSPFASPDAGRIEPLQLSKGAAKTLTERTQGLQAGMSALADTLFESLPMRREHLMVESERRSYILDDYVRFPTMEEVFVELIPIVHARRKSGKWTISVMLDDRLKDPAPQWSPSSLVLVDGVPVFDQGKIMEYDPALVKRIDVYPYTYVLGDRSYGGIINLITFKGNMPGVSFEDNVKIYDFEGASYPMCVRGTHTLYWHPLAKVAANGSSVTKLQGVRKGVNYIAVVQGLTSNGRPVYACKHFCL